MMNRSGPVITGVVGLTLGALLGWFAGSWTAPDPVVPVVVDCPAPRPCPACPACPEPSRVEVAPRPAVPVPVPSPGGGEIPQIVPTDKPGPFTVDQAASVEEHPEWSADWPWDHTPEGFAKRATEDLAPCDGPFHLLGTECEEPPCLAVLAGPPDGDRTLQSWLEGCTDWSQRYGATVDRWTRCSRILECPSGRVGFFTIAAQSALDRLADQGFEQLDLKALQQQRCEDATALFECP